MKKLNLLPAMCAMALLLSASSCMKNDPDDVQYYQTLQSYFNVYTNVNGSQQEIVSGLNYGVNYNITQGTASVAITGLKLPGGETYPTLTLSNLKFTTDDEGLWRNINDPAPILYESGFYVNISNLVLNVADRVIENVYSPASVVSYNIGDWYVNSFPEFYLTSGSPVVTSDEGVFEPDTDPAPYSLNFDPAKRTCSISIQGMQFAQNMPAQNMRFKDIPFTAIGNSIIVASTEPFTPYTISGSDTEVPFTRGEISNFRAVYFSNNGVTISFTFTMGGKSFKAEINSLYKK